jgi:hypothetical protein
MLEVSHHSTLYASISEPRDELGCDHSTAMEPAESATEIPGPASIIAIETPPGEMISGARRATSDVGVDDVA